MSTPDYRPGSVSVHVKTRSQRPGVTPRADGSFMVRVSAAPIDGLANESIRRTIAKYFGIARSKVRLIKGIRGQRKVYRLNW